jgi:hypothetical protein
MSICTLAPLVGDMTFWAADVGHLNPGRACRSRRSGGSGAARRAGSARTLLASVVAGRSTGWLLAGDPGGRGRADMPGTIHRRRSGAGSSPAGRCRPSAPPLTRIATAAITAVRRRRPRQAAIRTRGQDLSSGGASRAPAFQKSSHYARTTRDARGRHLLASPQVSASHRAERGRPPASLGAPGGDLTCCPTNRAGGTLRSLSHHRGPNKAH